MAIQSNNPRLGVFLAVAITTLLASRVGARRRPRAWSAIRHWKRRLNTVWMNLSLPCAKKVGPPVSANLLKVQKETCSSLSEWLKAGDLLDRLIKAHDIILPDGPEALAVKLTTWGETPTLVICGSDARGLMYAALDVAERISWAGRW